MTPLAIGVGCRRACPAAAITKLVERACGDRDRTGARLYTIEAKRGEAGLVEAARQLRLPLVFLPAACLRGASAQVTIHSKNALAALGVSSVAEAAALAGAGERAQLIVPRLAADGATCAVAIGLGAQNP